VNDKNKSIAGNTDTSAGPDYGRRAVLTGGVVALTAGATGLLAGCADRGAPAEGAAAPAAGGK